MRNLQIIVLIILFLFGNISGAVVLNGNVTEIGKGNKVVDAKTNEPISGAEISVPKKGYNTKSDENGNFVLGIKIEDDTIMAVKKDGYRPFSVTISKSDIASPIILGLQKTKTMDVVLDSEMLHLGDDNFSSNSANALDFKLKAIGPSYTKRFKMTSNTLGFKNYLIIGSILGVDTKMARQMKQNGVSNSWSSPPEVFFNGKKIAEIQLNGDNQRIKLPNSCIIPDGTNEITIQTGINLFQRAYRDYDDIELINLYIQTE